MKAACIVLVALLSTPASAQSGSMTFTTSPNAAVTIPPCEEAFPGLPQIAERLGVEEWKGNRPGQATMVLGTCDGRRYAFLELVHALLDKIDKAAK